MSDTIYTSGLITLENLVEETLAITERPDSDYKKFFQIAIRGYMDLRIHVVKEGKKQDVLTISDINKVNFPSDFIDFVSIGVVDGGKIWKLSQNNDFIVTTTEVAGVETQDSDEGEGVSIPNESVSGYYARGGSNDKGYYQIEWDKRRIGLINVTKDTVILTYITSGSSLSGTTYIPVKYAPALQSYIAWWSIALNDNIAISKRQMAERTYLMMRNQLRKSESPTLEEYEAALLSTFYPLAKR
jgi:hypothetical protein